MIRRSSVFPTAAITLALAIAACSNGTPTPSPSPTPTPTPTTTPTPTPVTYSTFPLTASQEFGTINAYTSYTGNLATGPVTLGVAGVEGPSTRFRLTLLADPTTASTATGGTPFVIRENTEEARYAAAGLTTPPATTTTEFAFDGTSISQNGTAATVLSARAELLNNTVSAKVTTDTQLNLLRTSYAAFIRDDSAAGNHRITYGVFGYPTALSDMPTTTATYTTRVAGRTVQAGAGGVGSVTKLGGTVTVTVNFATGAVTFTANLTLIGAGGAQTAYGTYTGSGAIPVGATTFSGSFGPTSPIPGTFTGALLGPQAAEIGIGFAASGTIGANDTRLVGVLAGKKN